MFSDIETENTRLFIVKGTVTVFDSAVPKPAILFHDSGNEDFSDCELVLKYDILKRQ